MKRYQMRLLLCAALACVVICLPAGCRREESKPVAKQEAGKQAGLEAVVTVNGVALDKPEFERQVKAKLDANAEFIKGLGPDARDQIEKNMRKSVVEYFIQNTLVMAEAERRKLTVSDEEIDKIVEQMKSRVPSGKTFEDFLRRTGTTENALRARLKREMAITKLGREVESKSDVTEAEIQSFYDTEKPNYLVEPETAVARHILIKCSADADQAIKDAKREVAEGLRAKLVAGADFATLAEKHSEDADTKDFGGNLGAIQRGKSVQQLDNALFSQEINAIGPVLEGPQGYHIVQVFKRAPATYLSLEQVKDRIRHTIATTKQSSGFDALVDKLRAGADIVYGKVDL